MDPINPIAGNPEALNQSPQIPEAPKDGHWITIAAMAVFVLLSLAAIVFLYYQNQQLKTMLAAYQTQPTPIPTMVSTPTPEVSASPSAKPKPTTVACTLEQKICPDGSLPKRNPDCSWAPCPTP